MNIIVTHIVCDVCSSATAVDDPPGAEMPMLEVGRSELVVAVEVAIKGLTVGVAPALMARLYAVSISLIK